MPHKRTRGTLSPAAAIAVQLTDWADSSSKQGVPPNSIPPPPPFPTLLSPQHHTSHTYIHIHTSYKRYWIHIDEINIPTNQPTNQQHHPIPLQSCSPNTVTPFTHQLLRRRIIPPNKIIKSHELRQKVLWQNPKSWLVLGAILDQLQTTLLTKLRMPIIKHTHTVHNSSKSHLSCTRVFFSSRIEF